MRMVRNCVQVAAPCVQLKSSACKSSQSAAVCGELPQVTASYRKLRRNAVDNGGSPWFTVSYRESPFPLFLRNDYCQLHKLLPVHRLHSFHNILKAHRPHGGLFFYVGVALEVIDRGA